MKLPLNPGDSIGDQSQGRDDRLGGLGRDLYASLSPSPLAQHSLLFISAMSLYVYDTEWREGG